MATALEIAGLAPAALAGPSDADTPRLLTWGGYAPEDVIAKFEAATGCEPLAGAGHGGDSGLVHIVTSGGLEVVAATQRRQLAPGGCCA